MNTLADLGRPGMMRWNTGAVMPEDRSGSWFVDRALPDRASRLKRPLDEAAGGASGLAVSRPAGRPRLHPIGGRARLCPLTGRPRKRLGNLRESGPIPGVAAAYGKTCPMRD